MRRPSNRRRLVTSAVALLAASTLAVACGTTKPSSSASSGAALDGITASTVKVGFTIADVGSLSKLLGFKDPDFGGISGESKAINAVVAYINQNGGMGGRQVTADIKTYRATTDTPEQSIAQCTSYTEDDKVFAVVMDSMFQNNGMPCYKDASTIVADESLIAHDQAQFEKFSPFLWSPTFPEYGAFIKAQLTAMNAKGFFDGNTGVLLMPSDDEVSRRSTTDVVQPYLASIGVTNVQTDYVDSTNTGTLGKTAAAALVAGSIAKLNRVVVIGGARIEPVALADPTAKGYTANWGIATFDVPSFIENNGNSLVEARRVGMTGLGFEPSIDVNQQQPPAWPDTTNAAQQKCYDIVSKAGATPPDNLRANWRMALHYCDGAFFLKSVLDGLPGTATVTGAQFKEAAAKIGPTYHSAATFGSQWGPGIYAGTNAGQALGWDTSCNCFTYSGSNLAFGSAAGSSTAPPATVPLTTVTAVP